MDVQSVKANFAGAVVAGAAALGTLTIPAQEAEAGPVVIGTPTTETTITIEGTMQALSPAWAGADIAQGDPVSFIFMLAPSGNDTNVNPDIASIADMVTAFNLTIGGFTATGSSGNISVLNDFGGGPDGVIIGFTAFDTQTGNTPFPLKGISFVAEDPSGADLTGDGLLQALQALDVDGGGLASRTLQFNFPPDVYRLPALSFTLSQTDVETGVPEPGSGVLYLTAAGAMAAALRRKRKDGGAEAPAPVVA